MDYMQYRQLVWNGHVSRIMACPEYLERVALSTTENGNEFEEKRKNEKEEKREQGMLW